MSIFPLSRPVRVVAALILASAWSLIPVSHTPAATSVWVGATTGEGWTDPNAWNPVGIPGSTDTALVTNIPPGAVQNVFWGSDVINSRAIFSTPESDSRDLYIGTRTWTVTDSLSIAPNGGNLDTIRHISGNLVVTNAAGTAKMELGYGSFWELSTLTVDRFISTNGLGSAGLATFAGTTWNFLHGAKIRPSTSFEISGAAWNFLGGTSVIQPTSGSYWLLSDGAPVVMRGPSTVVTNTGHLYLAWNGANTSILVTNGAQFISQGDAFMGSIAASRTNNTFTVTGNNSLAQIAGGLKVGVIASDNELNITDGATVDAGYVVLGTLAGSIDNRLLVSGTNSMLRAGLFVGDDGANGFGAGSVLINNGAAVEPYAMVTGVGGSGSISNRGGIYQFTTPNPIINPLTANTIVLTNGTISFRAINDASVHQSGTRLTNIVYQGINTFRLNAASNTAAASSQTYHFNTGLGASNYAHLAMVNGHTAYGNGNITVGSNGSMLISNTRASVLGSLTNNGVFTSINSIGTFSSAVVNNGAWITDPTTNVFLSSYTVGNAGSISMGAGDVFIFKSNFVNTSTQNTTYDTTEGKFLFDGAARTQSFYTAAHDVGPGPTLNPLTATNTMSGPLPDDNFVLGIFEIANFSTVRVSDAFSLLGPGTNDNLRAALYVNQLLMGANSFLVVDTNVTLYFVSSNNWSASNFVLLGDAELHQIVPEPSVLLLLSAGLAVVWRVRKR